MGLEVFNGNLSDLVITNPPGTDPKSQGDDHLRGIKKTLVDTFGATTGPIYGPGGLTFPDATVQGSSAYTKAESDGPAFAAVADGSQTIPSTPTKILFQTERFDTNNCFDNSRFTPTVAGYYQFNAGLAAQNTSSSCGVYIQKNGVTQASLFLFQSSAWCSALIYMNGTTDFAEAFGFLGTPGLTATADFGGTQFSGALVRRA